MSQVATLDDHDALSALARARVALGDKLTLMSGRLADRFDAFDVTTFIGLLGMLIGMWVWFGPGPAITVVFTLVFVGGVVGARQAGPVDEDEAD